MKRTDPLPRKILMTTDAVGGVWTYSLELSRALSSFGIAVTLAVMGPSPTPRQRREAAQLPRLKLVEIPVKLEWMDDPWDDLRKGGEELLRLADDSGAELVHLNGYLHASLPWGAPTLVVGHSCVLSWWESVRGESAPPSWDRYREGVRGGLQAAGAVVAPTRAMLQALERHYLPLPHGEVVYNGRSGAFFGPERKENLVLTAGRLWDQAKNVAAVQRVAPEIPWQVAVAGETASPGGSSVTLQNVRTLGPLSPSSLSAWYGRASIYALPARYEPFGLTPLEAALSGCALVLGDIDSLRELWEGCALFVPPDDADPLRTALLTLIEDESLRFRMVRRAAERAASFSPRRMAAGYLECYSRLLSESEEGCRHEPSLLPLGAA